ncbi:hypothetical protein [Halobacillus sp. K22]
MSTITHIRSVFIDYFYIEFGVATKFEVRTVNLRWNRLFLIE